VFVSAALHLWAFSGAANVPTDTATFLELAARWRGLPGIDDWSATPEPNPYAAYPLYSGVTYLASHIVGNFLQSARYVALGASVLVPVALVWCSRGFGQNLAPACWTGLWGLSSFAIVTAGVRPLSDSLFLLLSIVFLGFTLRWLSEPSLAHCLGAGIFAGLAGATRGQGLVWLVLFIVCAYIGRSNRPTGKILRMTVVFVALFLSIVWCSRLLVVQPQTPRLENYSHLREVLFDGALFSQGARLRDTVRYSLNDACTRLRAFDDIDRPWPDFIRRFRPLLLQGIERNLRDTFVRVLPQALAPIWCTLPLCAYGAIVLWRRREDGKFWLFALGVLPFLVVFPALQTNVRYALPVMAFVIPLAGIGASSLSEHSWRIGRMVVLVLAGFMLLYQLTYVSFLAGEDDWCKPYEKACQIIAEREPKSIVMTRFHGAYCYLLRPKVSLPTDTLDRVLRYFRHTGATHLLVGPLERDHNAALRKLDARVGARLVVGDEVLIVDAVAPSCNATWSVSVVSLESR